MLKIFSRLKNKVTPAPKPEPKPSYTHCMNCGEELQGMYCHKCGQYALDKPVVFKDFISEYVMTNYPLDTKILPTIRNLMFRPGFLTREFIDGKRASYVHPLKLNLFFLFVVITAMLLVASRPGKRPGLMEQVRDKATLSELAFFSIDQNPEYTEKLAASDKDTVTLLVYKMLDQGLKLENMGVLEARRASEEGSPDSLKMVLPVVLIEEGVVVERESGVYAISETVDSTKMHEDVDVFFSIWDRVVEFINKYLPLLVLLTCPLLAFVVRIFNRRSGRNYMQSFVFSLHYTAFLEMLFLFMLLLLPLLGPVISRYVALLAFASSFFYMAVAMKNVFNMSSWVKPGIKAVLVNVLYVMILFFFIFTIFIWSAFKAMG